MFRNAFRSGTIWLFLSFSFFFWRYSAIIFICGHLSITGLTPSTRHRCFLKKYVFSKIGAEFTIFFLRRRTFEKTYRYPSTYCSGWKMFSTKSFSSKSYFEVQLGDPFGESKNEHTFLIKFIVLKYCKWEVSQYKPNVESLQCGQNGCSTLRD